jgi:hypothetical protein
LVLEGSLGSPEVPHAERNADEPVEQGEAAKNQGDALDGA